MVSGPPGIGKTTFLDEVERRAAERSIQVVTTTPSETEVTIAYAGLHLLVQHHLAGLRVAQPDAADVLERCVMDAGQSGVGAIAMALIHLLEDLAETAPVLLRVDDVQWLDQPSFDAIVFAVRRLVDSPVACVLGVRDASARRELLLRAGFEDLPIPVLEHAEAREVLTRNASWLGPRDADTVLDQAAGNPLALVELPRALMRSTGQMPPPGQLVPLTARLENAFSERHILLPKLARDLLLVAASSDRDNRDEILTAVTRIPDWGDTEPSLALDLARDAGLVHVGEQRVTFEHPLIRSAIYQSATVAERQAAHRALSTVLDHEPARQIWHRASSTTDLDDDLATALVDTARQLSVAGDQETAVAALRRAARTARDPRRRAALSVDAMHQAVDLGRPDLVEEILATIDVALLDDLENNRLGWVRDVTRNGIYSGAAHVMALAPIARKIGMSGEPERAVGALREHSLRMWWSNPTLEERLAVTEAAEAVTPDPHDDVGLLMVRALATPMERAGAVAEHLDRLRPQVTQDQSVTDFWVALVAMAVGDYPAALPRILSAVEDFRRQGQFGVLVQALTASTWADIHTGIFLRAQASAEEAIRLAPDQGQALFYVTCQLASATALARRGDLESAEVLVASAERVLRERGAAPMLAMAQYARGSISITGGRYGEAVDHLLRIFDPSDECFHLYYRSLVAADLIEAAVHAGRLDDIKEQLATLEEHQRRTASKILTAQLVYAAPFLHEEDPEEHYIEALDSLRAWPFLSARTQLSYGMWLRRHRRLAEARHRLRIAAGSLPSLGAIVLAASAREELRAAGESPTTLGSSAWVSLTAHELRIAQLAAKGLSNRQIGDQMLLSHRTVSTHLYKIYPKLGISGRGQLAAALSEINDDRHTGT